MKAGETGQRVINNRYRVAAAGRLDLLAVTSDAYDMLADAPVSLLAVRKEKLRGTRGGYSLDKIRADMRFSQKLTHPDVLHCFDVFEDEDALYMVSEFSGLPALTALRPAATPGQAADLVRGVQKLAYVLEFYHNNQVAGCCIREGHLRIGANGETRIDSVMATRLSYFSDCDPHTARRLLDDAAEARLADLRLAGEVVRSVLKLIPEDAPELAELAASVVAPLKQVAVRLLKAGEAGGYHGIDEASAAMRAIEDRLRACLCESPRAFPSHSARRHFAAGELIFREGDQGHEEAFVIERGLVQISKTDPNGREIHLDVSRPGDILGEMALIDNAPRMATARAVEPCDLVVISGREFRANLARMDNVARRMIDVLAGRLRYQAGEVARLKALLGVCK